MHMTPKILNVLAGQCGGKLADFLQLLPGFDALSQRLLGQGQHNITPDEPGLMLDRIARGLLGLSRVGYLRRDPHQGFRVQP